MNAYVNYVIEANIGLLLFTIIYFILFEKETQFTFKRWYLLITIVASLVFPLIEFNTTQTVIPSISSVIRIAFLPEVIVRGGQSTAISTSTNINYWNVALGIYGIIACLLLLSFLIRVGKLLVYLKSNAFVQDGKFRIIESTINHPTFSFFHYIFIGNAHQLDQQEKEQIIHHEKLHASHVHSLDLLVSESLKIIFWFNPIVYILKNQLVSIHEYEADQQAVQHQDAGQYCELLARGSLASAGFSLANHFHNSLTLKRIVMINAKKTKIKSWKYLMLIPVFVIGFVVVSCEDQAKSEFKEVAKASSRGIYPTEVTTQLKQLETDYPGDEYIVLEMDKEGEEKLQKLNIKNIGQGEEYKNVKLVVSTASLNESARSFVILIKGTKKYMFDEKTKIYEAVQHAPTFPGGITALGEFLSKELHYPEQARRLGVQGKVFVQFVVDETGKVSDASLVKGIGAGCDAEAVRVIAKSPNWNPGKMDGLPVKVRYIVPINFKLD